MIKDWRAKWHAGTDGATDPVFPFGFVMLNSVGNASVYDHPKAQSPTGDPFSPAFGYGGVRWAQTAGYGYVPNPVMPKVFMGVVSRPALVCLLVDDRGHAACSLLSVLRGCSSACRRTTPHACSQASFSNLGLDGTNLVRRPTDEMCCHACGCATRQDP